MPDYEVTSPSGKKIIITGDQFPSEAELDSIFASVDTPKKEMGFMEALGKSLKPEGGVPVIPGMLSREGAGLLEIGTNLLSTPSRLLYSAFSDKPYNEALADKTELGKLVVGEPKGLGGTLGSLALDVVGDPTNLLGALGAVSKIGKGVKLSSELSDLTKVTKSEAFLEKLAGKSEKQISNLLTEIDSKIKKVPSDDAVNLALVKDHIKQATGRAKASPFDAVQETAKSPLDEVINLAKSELDPEKVGRGKLTKEMPERAFLAVDQDKVAQFRGGKLNLKEKARLAGEMSDDTINKLYDDAVTRKSYTVEDLFVIGEKVARNTDDVISSLKEGTINDALANFIAASTQKGQELRTISDVNDIIITSLRRGTMGDTDLAELLIQAGMKKGDVTPTFMDKFVEWATMIKLTGVSTHVKAILGNGSMLAFRPFEKLGAAAVSALTGKRSVYATEALQEVYKAIGSIPTAYRKAKNVIRSEELALGEASKFGEVVHRGGAISGKFGEIVRFPARVIGSVDIFFKELNYSAEVAAQATRLGLKRGLRGSELHEFIGKTIANPTDDIIKAAQTSSVERVFQEPLQGIAEKMNVLRENPFVRLIIPFWNTPVNLLKQSVQRTPLTAFLPSTWRTMKVANEATKAELMGRAVSGSMFMIGAWWMGTQGYLTAGGPTNSAQKESLRATGWQPYSIKAGDTYISYRGFEPISSWLRAAGDIAEGTTSKSRIDEIAKKFGVSYIGQFIENPFLMGIQDVTDAQRQFSKDEVPDIVTNLVIGSTVPTIVQQWGTRVYDPIIRRPKGAWEKIKSRLPFGVSETVSPARDVFGQQVERYNPALQALGFTISKDKDDRLANELSRLNIGIGRVSNRINEIELSEEEYDRLSVLTGAMIKSNLQKFMNAPVYNQIDDSIKDKTIRRIITKSRNLVKERDFQKYYMERR